MPCVSAFGGLFHDTPRDVALVFLTVTFKGALVGATEINKYVQCIKELKQSYLSIPWSN